MPPYSTAYFEALQEGARQSAQVVVPMIMEWISPIRVVDVGCGTGAWLDVFANHDVEDICGVDGPWIDPDVLQIPRDCFVSCDLSTSSPPLDKEYDLVVSLEVAEHLPPDTAASFVDTLTNLGPVVLFSAATPFQGGLDHQNEQWPDYWSKLFREQGYTPVDCLRPLIWTDEDVEWWYAQNTLLYVSDDCLDAYCLPSTSTNEPPLPLVHPSSYTALHESIREIKQQAAVHREENESLRTELEALQERIDELATWGGNLQKEVEALHRLEPGTVSLKQVLRALPSLIKETLKRNL